DRSDLIGLKFRDGESLLIFRLLNRRHQAAALSNQRWTVFQAMPLIRAIADLFTPSTLRGVDFIKSGATVLKSIIKVSRWSSRMSSHKLGTGNDDAFPTSSCRSRGERWLGCHLFPKERTACWDS